MLTLPIVKQYLNIHSTNSTDDVILQLLLDAAEIQASHIIKDENGAIIDNALIDVAILKDIATNYQHRENYLDPENGGLILSQGTISILNKFRKQVIY